MRGKQKIIKDYQEVPLTEELLNEIVETSSLENFFATNHVHKYTLKDYLEILIEDKELERTDVIRQAGLNQTYGYEIFTGRKKSPSRDIVIKIALVMKCNLDEANRLLKISGNTELYAKSKRDVIIIHSLVHELGIIETNEELHHYNEAIL